MIDRTEAIHRRLEALASTPVPDGAEAWEALSARLPDRVDEVGSTRDARAQRRTIRRVLAIAAAFLLIGGSAFASSRGAVVDGLRRFLDPAAPTVPAESGTGGASIQGVATVLEPDDDRLDGVADPDASGDGDQGGASQGSSDQGGTDQAGDEQGDDEQGSNDEGSGDGDGEGTGGSGSDGPGSGDEQGSGDSGSADQGSGSADQGSDDQGGSGSGDQGGSGSTDGVASEGEAQGGSSGSATDG